MSYKDPRLRWLICGLKTGFPCIPVCSDVCSQKLFVFFLPHNDQRIKLVYVLFALYVCWSVCECVAGSESEVGLQSKSAGAHLLF